MASKKDALNACGRLKKGFKFRKGGKIVNTKGKGRRAKRGTQGRLF
ncbi:hypothetical protein [Chromohalobacter nigrandesensis]|nr:hypothetical protein [Chromohalobacter nigrandesensis]MCK0745009.1 hypothetical protein [Chromohalobacter nigrandesensis]